MSSIGEGALSTDGSHRRAGTSRRAALWLLWLTLAGVGFSGLRYYRVDNDLGQWLPEYESLGAIQSYLVIGMSVDQPQLNTLTAELRDLSTVAFVVDPVTVMAAGGFTGVGADDFVLNREHRYAGIYVFRKPGATDQAFVDEVRSVADAENLKRADYALGGPAIFHLALNQASQARLPQIMLAITAVGWLMLWRVTRSSVTALEAMAAVLISQVVLVGAVSWMGNPMDMAMSMVPPLMMALGFSFAAHRALRPSSLAVLGLCGFTTAMGFTTFVFADLVPLRRFGVTAIFGIMIVWGAVLSLVRHTPSVRSCFPEPHALRKVFRRPVTCLVRRYRHVTIGIAILLTVSGAFAIPFLRFESDPLNYYPADSEIVHDFTLLNERLTGLLPFQVRVEGEADPKDLLLGTPGVRKVIDITPLVKHQGHVYWCLADNASVPELRAAFPVWQAWAESREVVLTWHGVAAQIARTGEAIVSIALLSLPLMAGVAALVVVGLTRSVLRGLISAWVNILPILVLTACAAVLQWPLDMPSLMIGAIATGIAIDDTLHLLAAARARGSIARATLVCLRPCVGSSVIAATCLALFAFSPFRPTAQFGIILAMAILVALTSDFILLPGLLGRHPPAPESS